jgi:hypothetical protein
VASVCDILTRPAPELSTEERTEVKKVARELLMRLKQLLVLNWRQKAAARSALRLALADPLSAIRIGGKLRTTNLEAFLSLLQQGFPITAEEHGARIVLKRHM